MMVRRGLVFFFFLKSFVPLQRYLLTYQANSAVLGRFFCTGQEQQPGSFTADRILAGVAFLEAKKKCLFLLKFLKFFSNSAACL